jgi:hypothetical protein
VEMTRAERRKAIAYCGFREHIYNSWRLVMNLSIGCATLILVGAHGLVFGDDLELRMLGLAGLAIGGIVSWPFLIYLRRGAAPEDDGDLALAMRAVRVHTNGPDDWWVECVLCGKRTVTSFATERQAREWFGRHLWNDPHPAP